MSIDKINIGTQQDIFQEKYNMFLENNEIGSDIQDIMRYTTSILETGDKPFSIHQKERIISIPNLQPEERENVSIIRKTKRIKIHEIIDIIQQTHPFFSSDSIKNILFDIVAYTNAYIKQNTKRGSAKLRSIQIDNRTYSILEETQQEATIDIAQQEIAQTLSNNPKDIPIHTITDLVKTINESTFPIKIDVVSHEIIIDEYAALKIHHLKSPKDYMGRVEENKYSFDLIILRCIEKWGKNIEGKDIIEKYIGENSKNGEKVILYKYIIQNLIKLYYIYTERHLTLKYGNGKEVSHERKDIKMSIQFTNEHYKRKDAKRSNILQTSDQYIQPRYTSKKRIPKNLVNDKKTFDKELIMSLGYDKSYATKLCDFVSNFIVKSKENFDVEGVAHMRNSIDAMHIQDFNTTTQTSFYIRSLDNILNNYLIDKARSYNENWTKVSAANRK